MKWKLLPIPSDDPQLYRDAVRLNSLGSLFFFTHFVLKKHRLAKLHWHMCSTLETEDLHLVFEIPMSHFKTTCGVEGLSMWWALPFTERDEALMRGLGYDDEWIRWMRAAHDQNARTLVTHETSARVVSMGKALDDHYMHNDIFRFAFSEVIPTSEAQWNNHSKMHARDRAKPMDLTTATYEFRSVGQPLQGIHVSGIINDDSVGKAAQDNWLNSDGSTSIPSSPSSVRRPPATNRTTCSATSDAISRPPGLVNASSALTPFMRVKRIRFSVEEGIDWRKLSRLAR